MQHSLRFLTRCWVRPLGLLLLLGTSLLAQAQAIRYVKPVASGTGDGSSWTNASGDLQSQINFTGANQVWVAAGLYKPTTTTDRTISFALEAWVAVYGGFVGSESSLSQRPVINPVSSQPSSTTLSGDIGTAGNKADNSYHVMNNSGLTSTARLDGFVITGGNADGSGSESSGGGMYNASSSPSVTNCSFIANSARFNGGGMENRGGSSSVTNCSFIANTANDGGGMYNVSSNPSVTSCSFQANSAFFGGGMNNSSSNPSVTNCSFQANSARLDGGGMYNLSNSNPSVTNCVFFDNGGSNTFFNSSSSVSASYSLFDAAVTGYTNGAGNRTTTTSPFASPTTTQLSACSPAIDAGINSASALVGITTDLAGNPRFFNNGTVDMGAYEWQTTASTPIALLSQPPAGSAVCPGGSVTVSVRTRGSVTGYQWYKDGQVLSPAQPSASLSITGVQPTDAGSYSLVVTGACNSLTSTAFSLTVNPRPTVSITLSPSATLTCAQTSLTLTATGATSYTLSDGQTSTDGVFTLSLPDTYTLTAASAGGCVSTTSTQVVSHTLTPPASLSNDGPLSCLKTSVTLTAGGGLSYRFSTGASQTGTTNQATINTAGTYSVTVTSTNGCTATANTTVNENKNPPTASLSNNGPLSAAMSSVTLTAAPGGVVYAFSAGASQVGGSSGNTATVTTPGTYSVSITGANGCTASAATSVTTTATPTSSQTACRNSRLVLTTARPAARYEWYKNGQTAANKLIDVASLQVGTTTASLTLVSVQTSATYYVKEIQAGGSVSWSGPFSLTVDARCLARMGLEEPGLSLSVQVAPNPLAGGQLQASVRGAEGGPLTVQLVDARGYVVREQHWPQAGPTEVVSWDVSPQPAGVYILQALTKQQRQTSKVLKL